MTDLLVISHACFMAINRNIYHLFMQDGWNVEMVVPVSLNFPTGKKKAELPGEGDPFIHYLNLNGDNPRTYLFEGLKNVLEEQKPRIVLLDNDPVSRLALVVGKWCSQNNTKFFCTSCENFPLDVFSAIKRRGWKNLPAAIVKRILLNKTKKVVDGVFTINSSGKQIFINEGYKNVEQIPLGFDPDYFYPDTRTRALLRTKLGLTKTVIAYFGRLTKEKGVHILIKALQELKELEWLMMMDDFDEYASDYNKEIIRLIKAADIMERVVFINPSHYEIAGYMNAADIVVVPSITVPNWKEQYGRVAAEAMACGKTVIASDSGALPELLNRHGWLFPEGDVQSLKKLLKDLLSINNSLNENSRHNISAYAKNELSLVRQKIIMQAVFAKINKLQKKENDNNNN